MDKRIINKYLPYAVFLVLSFLPLGLIFNDNIWFDESYTLSLIWHNYNEIIEILQSDMHPPLYFLSLKVFCSIFGYSICTSKIFSVLGYIATLFLGCTIYKKRFGNYISVLYMLIISACPITLYFAVQQRAYSWCIFFVTFCFIEALLFIENRGKYHSVLFSISALFASYNHIYALLAVGIIYIFVNIYIFIKNRSLWLYALLADLIVVLGYLPWLVVLLNQVKEASESFWLTELEPRSIEFFVISAVVVFIMLIQKKNRTLPIIFGAFGFLTLQVIGLAVSMLIRPLYLARYAGIVLGVFSIFVAMCIGNYSKKIKQVFCILICVANIVSFIFVACFEYNPSFDNFKKKFQSVITVSDTFVYCDSSFGIMSYCYPENRHICSYYISWFDAFGNVEYIEKDKIADELMNEENIWFVVNTQKKLPKWITENFELEQYDTFTIDFNTFDVYTLSLINET